MLGSPEGFEGHQPDDRLGPDPDGEHSLRLLVGSVIDYAIFMLDPHGRVVTWNEGAHRLKQYERAEILGRHFSVFYPAADRAAGKPDRLLQEATRAGRVEDEGWRVRRDGSSFWADVVITAVRDPDGELRGFAKVTRDLTERRQGEESLRVALAREREALERVRETDRRRHGLVAMVAHDLRSPVTVLQGTTNTLLADWDRLDEDARITLLSRMQATTDHMRGLVDDVLDTARIDTGTLLLAMAEVELMAIVHRAAGDLDPHRERIRIHASPRPVHVCADERRTWQILTNLLGNAMKFSPADSPVDVVVDTGQATATVAVSDRGVGISAADQARLFEPFSRVGPGAARHSGTGLGLYISHGLASAQGGTLTVSSSPEAGSTFSLTLRLAHD